VIDAQLDSQKIKNKLPLNFLLDFFVILNFVFSCYSDGYNC
jgi:hypothetical protein